VVQPDYCRGSDQSIWLHAIPRHSNSLNLNPASGGYDRFFRSASFWRWSCRAFSVVS